MISDTENLNSFDFEYPSYKLEDPKYILEVLKEYHEQTVEDCRIIGNQKYNVLISLSIALGSFIYALTQVCASTGTNFNYTIEGTLKTLYSNTPSTLSLSGNTSSILSEANNIASIQLPSLIIPAMIITSLILFIFISFMAISGFAFLMMHLPLMDKLSIKIEELQRDILFKKMGNVDLFNWDEIKTNKSKTFKDYLNQKFIFENIKHVNTSLNDHQILIDITRKNIINEITRKNIIKTEKKSGTLNLDKEKMIAILIINGLELDQFNVKEKNDHFILYESEMKYRFRNLMPHFNVLKPSYNTNLKSIGLSIISLIAVAILIIVYLRYQAVY